MTEPGVESFLNGGGAGVESAGSLALQYTNAGWFGCYIYTDVSSHTYLVLRLAGDHRGLGPRATRGVLGVTV